MVNDSSPVLKLPQPSYDSKVSIEEVLRKRRSVREFVSKPLTLQEVSQILWAAQGVTDKEGLRTAPSAGALYPLELVLVAGQVHEMEAGVYRYRPLFHDLLRAEEGDSRSRLAAAALKQEFIADAAVVLAIAAVYERTTKKYGQRGRQYVHMEVGHVVQSVSLQAEALGLGSVVVGAFDDRVVTKTLGLSGKEVPLAIMPIGHRRGRS